MQTIRAHRENKHSIIFNEKSYTTFAFYGLYIVFRGALKAIYSSFSSNLKLVFEKLKSLNPENKMLTNSAQTFVFADTTIK